MRPAVILARVSDPEQEAGHSLEAQLSNLQEYAKNHELEVIQVFRIIESSTKGYRPEFERLIEFIGKQKQRTALIVDCVDRLQRSFTHTPVLNALMERNLLEIHFVREGNVIDKDANSMQKMVWNLGTVMAQSYTDQLTDNVRRSIKHKIEKGEWIARAPLSDFTTDSGTIYIHAPKSGVSRHAVLTDEGKEFFKNAVLGKDSNALVFTHADGAAWGKSHQHRPLKEACARVKIKPAISFHVLRHTHGSLLAMKGVPMPVISKQLGHADTRMTERHYAHLSPSYVADTIRQNFPTLGVVEESNVTALDSRKRSRQQ